MRGCVCHHCVFQWSARSSVYRLRTTIMRTADEVEENATHSTMEQPARSSCLKREEGEGLTAVFAVGRGGGERERERDTHTHTHTNERKKREKQRVCLNTQRQSKKEKSQQIPETRPCFLHKGQARCDPVSGVMEPFPLICSTQTQINLGVDSGPDMHFAHMASNYLPVSSLAGSISSDKVTGDSRERARQEIARSGGSGKEGGKGNDEIMIWWLRNKNKNP